MKKFLLSVLVVAACAVASPVSARTFGFGVTGGLNVSKLDEDGAKSNSGWFAGVTAKVTVPVLGFGLDGALLYSTEKVEAEAKDKNAQYISVPVNLRYDFQLPVVSKVLVPYAFLGPQFDWNINNAKLNFFDEEEGGYGLKAKDATWKANFGIGALLFNHVQVSYAYSLPISNSWSWDTVYDNVEGARKNTKLATHKVGVTYFF